MPGKGGTEGRLCSQLPQKACVRHPMRPSPVGRSVSRFTLLLLLPSLLSLRGEADE